MEAAEELTGFGSGFRRFSADLYESDSSGAFAEFRHS